MTTLNSIAPVQTQGENAEEFERPKKDVAIIWYCSLIVNWPKTAFGLALSGHILTLVLTGSLFLSGYNLFPTVFNDLPLQLKHDDTLLRSFAWQKRLGNNASGFVAHLDDGNDPGDEETGLFEKVYLIYENPGGNVFSQQCLRAIKEIEDKIIQMYEEENYCEKDDFDNCKKPLSILRFFDGTYATAFNESKLNDPDFDNISDVLYFADNNDDTTKLLQFHLASDSSLQSDSAISERTRSLFYLGTSSDENVAAFKSFLKNGLNGYLGNLFANGYIEIENIYYSGDYLQELEVNKQVLFSTFLVSGSVVFIFTFMRLQTGSFWVSGFAVFSIIASFLGTNLIYRVILDYKFLGIFHMLAMFLILGIGADDVFVFFDSWKLTEQYNYESLTHRLSDTFRRSIQSMLITSVTTAIAFMVNAFSPLLGLYYTFGIFAGILVLYNYISVVIFFPIVVITYYLLWEKKLCCCCGTSKRLDPKKKGKNPIISFFAGPYLKFITDNRTRVVVLLAALGLIIGAAYTASLIEPQEEAIQIFREYNNFALFRERFSGDAFKLDDDERLVKVYIVWGLENQDLTQCEKTDYECTGKTNYDDRFDLNPPHAQQALLDFCSELRNLSDDMVDKLKIRRDIVTEELEIDCFIENIKEFYEAENLLEIYENHSTEVEIPTSELKIRTLMEANPATFDLNSIHDTYYHYFEVALDYWLTKRYSATANDEIYLKFSELLGEVEDEDTHVIGDGSGVYGTRLKFAAISVQTTLNFGKVGFGTGVPIINDWEDFVSEKIKEMPPTLRNGFQLTAREEGWAGGLWHWVFAQKSLADSATRGIITGLACALPILILSTRNVIVGLLSTLSIISTTVCVLTIMPLAGWKLGVLESLNLSLIVGLAVDYVVHLAEAYCFSKRQDRLGKVQDMLEQVGISVLSGAITTLGASFFMLFSVIRFFMQFGLFLFATLGFSLVFSLLVFPTIMGIIGPVGNVGSLVTFYYSLIGRKMSDVKCETCKGKGFHQPEISGCNTTSKNTPNHHSVYNYAMDESNQFDSKKEELYEMTTEEHGSTTISENNGIVNPGYVKS